MKANNTFFKQITKLGLLLMMGLTMTACGAGSIKWKEEVQLSDGKVIVVERELITKGGGDEWASNSGGVMPKEYHIEFNDPNNSAKTVNWISMKKDIATWPEIPLILDVHSGQYVIFTTIFTPGGCKMYNKYLYQNGTWVEEKLPPSFEQRASNLFVMRKEDFKKFIDLKTKQVIVSKHFSADRSDGYDQVGPTHPNCKGI